MAQQKARIVKKVHNRYLIDFFIEATQDDAWNKQLKELAVEGRINTSENGFPANFVSFFPETEKMGLTYSIERVELNDIPREASCWWPIEESTQYYMAYPTNFPQAAVFLAIDFDEHDHEHDH